VKLLSAPSQGLIAINLLAVIVGSSALFGTINVSPLWIVASRCGFAAIALFIVGVIKGNQAWTLPAKWLPVFQTGVILACHWVLFFYAVQHAGIAIATLTFATFPLFTLIFQAWQQNRKPYIAEIMCGLIIIGAVSLLMSPEQQSTSILGFMAGIASAITFVAFSHISQQCKTYMRGDQLIVLQNASAALVLIPFLFHTSRTPHHVAEWSSLIALGVINTALVFKLYYYSLERLSASVCSGFIALEPVYAILLAWVICHQPLHATVALSGFMIFLSSLGIMKIEQSKQLKLRAS